MSRPISVLMPVMIFEEWQRLMTLHAIELLRLCTDVPFRLVVVETGSAHLNGVADVWIGRDISPENCQAFDANIGLERCDQDGLVLYTGNDVFVRPGYMEALLRVFDEKPEAGAATLASADHRHLPNWEARVERGGIYEGYYGPFMMFPARWRYEPEYRELFLDTDLIMRICRSGKRMYRNWDVAIEHFNKSTHRSKIQRGLIQHDNAYNEARDLFIKKHGDCGLLVYDILMSGQIV